MEDRGLIPSSLKGEGYLLYITLLLKRMFIYNRIKKVILYLAYP